MQNYITNYTNTKHKVNISELEQDFIEECLSQETECWSDFCSEHIGY